MKKILKLACFGAAAVAGVMFAKKVLNAEDKGWDYDDSLDDLDDFDDYEDDNDAECDSCDYCKGSKGKEFDDLDSEQHQKDAAKSVQTPDGSKLSDEDVFTLSEDESAEA